AGEKGQLKWMSFNEGVAEAKKTGRKVMIDVYTDWCGWCKKMDKDTYADAGVADYLNKKYVAIKLNAESSTKLKYRGQSYTEQELSAAFGVTGYPSIIFMQSDGEPITVYPGYADADKFKTVLSYIAEDHYKTTKFQDYVGAKQ
ncbi:MAG: thioredoxin fold domain-containing protein, partial [Bacteroidota bacterium]